jgi:hypothetical protein
MLLSGGGGGGQQQQLQLKQHHRPSVFGAPLSCPNAQVSCRNSSAVADTCCFNSPGGQLLLTQFWDSNPPLGPTNSWTIHGLWYVWRSLYIYIYILYIYLYFALFFHLFTFSPSHFFSIILLFWNIDVTFPILVFF